MTWRKYKRLLLVALVPLLVAGWLVSRFASPFEGSAVTCEESETFENCRQIGWEGPLYDSVKAEQSAWFHIGFPDQLEFPVFMSFEGSERFISGAKIVSVDPYYGNSASGQATLKSFIGRTANLHLGITQNSKSYIFPEGMALACNELDLPMPGQRFVAACFGDGWSGKFAFEVTGVGKDRLERLQLAVADELADIRRDYRIYQIVMYPIFLYLFLLVSGAIWLVRLASRYVRAG